MFTVKYDSTSKKHVAYKGNEQCAIITNSVLTLTPGSILSIYEICEILEMSGH